MQSLSNLIWLPLYRHFLFPIIYFGLFFLRPFNSKINQGFRLRRGRPWLKVEGGTHPVWIHASSMEFEYAKPLIRELKRKNPSRKIMVTYFSPSAQKAVSQFEGIDIHSPSPWECRRSVQQFLNHHKPAALLFARTDVWPEITYQSRKQGIPVYLFSATLAENSSRLKFFVRPFMRWLYSYVSQIYCVSERDKKNFTELGVRERCEVLGDSRFDQVVARLRSPKTIKPLISDSNVRTIIFGSTWPEDEAIIFASLKGLDKFKYNLIFVPHEPSERHVSKIQDELELIGYKSFRYSGLNSPLLPGQVLIVDQIGILPELYQLSTLAFVGGSFKKNVHSVMEPLASGCLTVVGPYYQNNREAIEFESLGWVKVVRDATALRSLIEKEAFLSAGELKNRQNQIASEILNRSGISAKLVQRMSL